MGKVKLTIPRKRNEGVRFDLQSINLGSDERRKSCIIGTASPSPAGNGTGSILLGHKRWRKADVLEQGTAHRTCGDVVANQFLNQLSSRKLFLWPNEVASSNLAISSRSSEYVVSMDSGFFCTKASSIF